MTSQVTLLLICMLFSKALSLICQQCLPAISETCQPITCSDQCLTTTASMYMGSTGSDVIIKTCGTPNDCLNRSINLGFLKMAGNTKCCNTDLCNTETLPALPKQTPNGRTCYTCDDSSCSGTVSCEGDEDRCISATVKLESNTIYIKGCLSKIICTSPGMNTTEIDVTNLQCCEGNLCNGAESFTLSFILMIVLLLSSVLF